MMILPLPRILLRMNSRDIENSFAPVRLFCRKNIESEFYEYGMQFRRFKNKTDYLEYLQLFVFHELNIMKNKWVDIEKYIDFELKDTTVDAFNQWVGNIDEADPVKVWFDKNKELISQFRHNFNDKFKPKVCVWSDRSKTDYFKEKLQDAFIFENYIAGLISEKYGLDLGQYLTPEGQYDLGENALGIEIKNDTLIKKYGNVYIEYQEKSDANNWEYVNSGILKVDNCEYWLIGTADRFYIFRKNRLLEIFREEIDLHSKGLKSARGISFKQIATSKGYVYPVKNVIANGDTISMDTMIGEIRETQS